MSTTKITTLNFKLYPELKVQYVFKNGYCYFEKRQAEAYKKERMPTRRKPLLLNARKTYRQNLSNYKQNCLSWRRTRPKATTWLLPLRELRP